MKTQATEGEKILQTTYSMKELNLEYRENSQNLTVKKNLSTITLNLFPIFLRYCRSLIPILFTSISFAAHLLSFKSFIYFTFRTVII